MMMIRLDLTTPGQPPYGAGIMLSWTAKTKSGIPCRSRVLAVAEEHATLAGVMLRLDQRLRDDGLDDITVTLG